MPVPSLPKVGAPPALAPLRMRAHLVGRRLHPFSNDYPYEDYAEGGEFIDTVAISESDRRKIAYANARALYKL